VVIGTVAPTGQAAEMGMRSGDIVLRVNGAPIMSRTQLAMLVRSLPRPIKLDIGRLEKIGRTARKLSGCVYTRQLEGTRLASDVVANLTRYNVKKELFRQRRRLEDSSCILALAGIAVMQVTVEMTPTQFAKENSVSRLPVQTVKSAV
jgi:hypothetical protein